MKIKANEELYHVPDHLFSEFCKSEFRINKGVLNTIDKWFYQRGLQNIIDRRKTIIEFFYFIKTNENCNQVKFGPGGLTSRLLKFWK